MSGNTSPLRIGIVAAELSGDLLGAGLIQALQTRFPQAQFEGIGGPRMIAAGCRSMFPMERLSVMGLVEVLRHLPELLRIRRQLVRHFCANPPDLFVGVDAPDFNLGLERKLKRIGIPTVQYVCPSVWAWRTWRVKKIRRSADLVLCLLPFEKPFLEQHHIRAADVGHPLADEIPLEIDADAARTRIGFAVGSRTVALLPGSRMSEVRSLTTDFLRAALRCLEREPSLQFVVPLASPRIRAWFEEQLQQIAPSLPITLLDGNSRDAMAAADVVLAASGTATLEALLLKRPTVVAYRVHTLTYEIGQRLLRLLKIKHVSLSNLVAGEELAPEFIQYAVTPDTLADAVMRFLESPGQVTAIQARYRELHQQMRRDASQAAAEAVLELIGKR